ncbi:TetR/AcrR family transcriptional regulator [Lacticaseibacillus casei]|uniref:TetR/AcrR family transcriptional regulator n=1 Tax=Lacticaseibacillus huelsenbergensis TaxID=3035291 RepID=A0ABY8DSM8_9LACO|nr:MULTISPECIES: TetR/AcrR family transcriptional regulator [Lacticaseibacillus]MDG3061038.1 TetR/AcrR family transcriptional regulator [Lacticaseibacillus sp. BCRC 81376]QVI37191.1 TetR/AcrR family transcriptional regulator [Lacticaseibacillus casei]QXG58983.1 TetR/AcrR family transcriptional regulator [Lacticaseibacillus casei]WFB39572.1 TetR/AcrR family transcriptional regulator [Lacticaseibacillus huelsenbergensis]WFB41272.1 TetR/AcrR family transcriptional regulator [Lacticaseibacillus hu
MNTREKLVATAADLFQEEGVRATGLSKILAVSGTPKGSLYYYFPEGKVQLIEAAIEYAGAQILVRVKQALERDAAPEIALTGQLAEMAEEMQQHGRLSSHSISLIALETRDDPKLQAACSAVYTQLEDLYTDKLVSAGMSVVPARQLGQFVQATIEGTIMIATTKANPDLLRQTAAHLSYLIKQALTS